MQGVAFLQDLTMVMLVAGLVTVLCHWLRQPVVLGYILAGVIIGPYTPPFPLVTDPGSIQTLSQLGVVMLMFTLGLQFSLKGLFRVGPTAGVAATLEILLMIWLGYQLGRFFGWNQIDSIFLGAMLLSSSTVIIVKALNDLKMSEEPFAKFVFGILVLDDIAAIVAIAVLSGIALSGTFETSALLLTSGRIGLFFTAVLVLGLLALPRLLRFIDSFKNNEVLLVSVLGIGFGMAMLAVKLGFSTALGAFLIGAIIAETREGGKIRDLVEPVRDMFSAVFFVSIGLLLDPHMIVDHWWVVLIVTVMLVLGKTITGAIGSLVVGNDPHTSLRVGMGLAQIGEFAFIIATLGKELKVTSEFLYPIAVCVSGLTTISTPLLIKNSDRLAQGIETVTPRGIKSFIEFYQQWLLRYRTAHRQPDQVRVLLRRWALQMALNLVLITAIFVAASAMSIGWFERLEPLGHLPGGVNAALFTAAMLLSLPLVVATLRKLRAAAMLMAEASFISRKPEHYAILRNLATRAVTGGGVLLLVLYMLMIAAPIVPTWPVLLALLALASLITAIYWSGLIRLYAGAQVSLRDTLTAQMPVASSPDTIEAHTILKNAVMETLVMSPTSPAVGKLIRELELRSVTGASIVAIERGEESIINPGPDEELKAGDHILLIGDRQQVLAGRQALS